MSSLWTSFYRVYEFIRMIERGPRGSGEFRGKFWSILEHDSTTGFLMHCSESRSRGLGSRLHRRNFGSRNLSLQTRTGGHNRICVHMGVLHDRMGYIAVMMASVA